MIWHIREEGVSLQPLADTFCDSDRSDILYGNQTDQMRSPQLGERVFNAPVRCFGRITTSPTLRSQGPADFKIRPALGKPWADPSHELARFFLLNGKKAKSSKVPVADDPAE